MNVGTNTPSGAASTLWSSGRKAAISLTYDDGLSCHVNAVGPQLESYGLRGTFYAVISESLRREPEKWAALAKRGHELGNHSLFHPCRRMPSHKDWLAPCFDLRKYTPTRLKKELEVANFILELLDGQKIRSYGNTCCDISIGENDEEMLMDSILEELVIAARGPFSRQIIRPESDMNFYQLGHFGADGRQADEICQEIEEAIEVGGWIIYMFHGIGEGTHKLYMEPEEHAKVLEWIAARQKELWCAPVVDVATHLRKRFGALFALCRGG